ncbi:MAG TPA: DNA polymerase III subunit alpha, partial [Planctomycetaceae bacterium]|nr:DNA polymerase III subunit alpha [Planctomycetaceae bacterium]
MTEPRPFAHLHCHTHYSLLDGANRIPELVTKVKEAGMNSLAITDHGNLYGAIEFYHACREQGVNPILGYEAYIAPGKRSDRSGASRMKEASYHLTLLAMNRKGFENLLHMSSVAYLEGFYYKPRIDKELLEEYNEGLICLSGCAAGELSQFLLQDKKDDADNLIAWYERVFGDRFYMEIQNAGFQIQKECGDMTIDLANRKGFPLVATNDAHYLNQGDARAHDILLCVNTRTTVHDEKRMRMDSDELFVRTPEEMYSAFPDQADAVARSQEIADRVDIELDLSTPHYPVFHPPEQKTDSEYLRELCQKGLEWRYGDEVSDVHRERLDYELKVIEQMGYASYFLIVWDFVRFAMEEGIPCQARGSACGAIVAYLLGFSHVCPLKYDLLFERFLDPSRTEPPDIDIDFCRDRRQLVIDYTKQKYGEFNVAQIGTFGTLKAKNAIRDVSRALGIDLGRVDAICKMVPDTLNIKLNTVLKESAELQQAYDSDDQIREMLDLAIKIEGLARSAGTHAAGVVVADEPISKYIPLQTITGKTDIITQWDGPTVEMVGLLKMDFLGLRNLTILDKAIINVKRHHPNQQDLDPLKFPLDDRETFELLQRGETKGIFQLESGGMRDLLQKMKPDKFNDIIATSALYRPGPLEGGMVMTYVEVKHGRQPIPKVHPIVDEILDETYGVMVYQEQVMRILNRVGGIELPAAYRCIKAISKKKEKIIASFHQEYIEGAQQRGVEKKLAEELFELIKKFAGYGFNKSHSTAYGA